MRICGSKKNKSVSISNIETLPSDLLIIEVLRRVAASSLTSIINVKLSCKRLKEMGEDKCIYQHVALDKIPIVEWRRRLKEEKERYELFLDKCEKAENPERLYRLALVDYIKNENPNLKSIHDKLDRAKKQGHVGALYVTCIIFLFSGDEDLKRKGIKLIGSMKKSAFSKRILRNNRTKLMKELALMWKNNPVLKDRPVFCTEGHQWRYKNQWDGQEEVDYGCHACNADAEIKLIYDSI